MQSPSRRVATHEDSVGRSPPPSLRSDARWRTIGMARELRSVVAPCLRPRRARLRFTEHRCYTAAARRHAKNPQSVSLMCGRLSVPPGQPQAMLPLPGHCSELEWFATCFPCGLSIHGYMPVSTGLALTPSVPTHVILWQMMGPSRGSFSFAHMPYCRLLRRITSSYDRGGISFDFNFPPAMSLETTLSDITMRLRRRKIPERAGDFPRYYLARFPGTRLGHSGQPSCGLNFRLAKDGADFALCASSVEADGLH